jgi:hypothetical protein
MKHLRWISTVAALVAGVMAQAQAPGELNLFGNDFPGPETRPMVVNGRQANVAVGNSAPKVAEGYEQALIFHNGRRLRGELAEVTKDEVLWRRKDASEPLRFARADVRRVLLVPGEKLANPNSVAVRARVTAAAQKDKPNPATVKLPGGDWLRGALTSSDGQTFALTLNGGAPIEVPRAQIEWLSFGPQAAPAFGLGTGPMALEGWLAGGTPRVETKDGTMTIQDAQWIGRSLSTPSRFEVAFEVPADGEEGLRLWLQPFNPQPNSYSTGTVQFRFGRKSLKWLVFQDTVEPKDLPLTAEAKAESGNVRYRVLYDGPGQRVVLLRNGRQLGDWSLKPKVEQPGNGNAGQERLPRGLCLDMENSGQESKLKLRGLSVAPWDGVMPDANGVAATEDQLSTPTPPTVAGRLEEVREKELVFAGKTVPIVPDTLVKFPQAPDALEGGEAMLSFGDQGELTFANLLVSEGKVRGRAVFATALELPATALQFIAFAPRKDAAMGAGDLLVFRNGDELPGELVTAATGAPLHWRLATGQEIEFQTDRIAGVRLTSASKVQPAGTMELRSGERLRGTLAAFDDGQLRWNHALLGELAVDRAQLWRLYPNSKQSVKDGSQNPDRWLRDTPNARRFMYYNRTRPRSTSWLALDGRFILRGQDGGGNGEQTLGPICDLGGGLDRFELRVDMVAPGQNQGNLNINFFSSDEAGAVMNLSPYEMNLYVQNPKSNMGGGSREFPLQDKIGENVRQLSLRAFVNGPVGTIDFYVNGYFIGRTGQTAAERLPGVGKSLAIDTYTYGRGSQILLSQVSVMPWSGELPHPGETAPTTVLANGDVAAGAPTSLTDGHWKLESDIGPLDLPVEKVQAVEFGGEMQPATAAGRLRLVDGSALLVDRFEWKGGELTAHHALFGDLKVPAGAVGELIFNPAPVIAPTVQVPKKTAKKDEPQPQNFVR